MRQAFSFIELVVSIVVIGIVFMSVPLILVETEKSTAFSLQQEGVMGAVATMTDILSLHWDENETNRTINGGFAKVLDVTGGAAALNRNPSTSNRRIGHFKGEYRRKFYDYIDPGQIFATATLGMEANDGGVADDIDDYNTLNFDVNESNRTIGYKYGFAITTRVYYISDTGFNYTTPGVWQIPKTSTGVVGTTNIKMVEVNASSAEGTISLYAFSSNIGEYKILHRSYPHD